MSGPRLPQELPPGVSWTTLKLDGTETIDIVGLRLDMPPRATVKCTVHRAAGGSETIALRCRLDTCREVNWYQSGGILNYVFDQIRRRSATRQEPTAIA